MRTIDVQFPRNPTYTGKAGDFTGQHYAYLLTDEQAKQLTDTKAEFAVVQAPGDQGPLQVVKIVGEPSDAPEKATRHIICLVDMSAYKASLERVKEAKKIRAEIKRLADEAAEKARLAALGKDNPAIAEMLARLEALGV